MSRIRFFPAIAGLVLVLCPAPAWTINKCVDADGAISFQDGPCPEGVDAVVVTLRPEAGADGADGDASDAAAGSGPDADDDRFDTEILELVSVQATFEGCAGLSDGFAQRHHAVLAQWRSLNAGALQRLGGSGRYRMLKERGVEQMRTDSQGGAGPMLARFCEGQFIPALQQALDNG